MENKIIIPKITENIIKQYSVEAKKYNVNSSFMVLFKELLIPYFYNNDEKNVPLFEQYDIDNCKFYDYDNLIFLELLELQYNSEEFEYNPNHWIDRINDAENNNQRQIYIFEDEFLKSPNIVCSRILNIFNKTPIKIYARKCVVKDITKLPIVNQFLEENHIQGKIISNETALGLYHNDILVSIMCFGKPRINMGKKNHSNNERELLRFCNKIYCNVVGGASKLLKYYIDNYCSKNNITEIYTFADRRWSNGNMYKKLGFEYIGQTKPNYYYVNPGINNKLYFFRENRFKYRKDQLVEKYGCDVNDTERNFMRNIMKFPRIYDAGNLKFIKKIK